MTGRLGLVFFVGWSCLAGIPGRPALGDDSPPLEREPVSENAQTSSAGQEVDETRWAKNPDDAVSLHNLGLVYLREGRVDAGIARLIQASLAAPRSEIVRRHLRDAASHHGIESQRLRIFERMAAALRWRNLLLIGGAVSFWIGGAGWLAAGRQMSGWLRPLCGLVCLLGALAIGSGVFLHRMCPSPKDFITFEKNTTLHAAPSEQAPAIASLPSLQIVRVTGEKEPWSFVENPRGTGGWVRTPSILPLLLQK